MRHTTIIYVILFIISFKAIGQTSKNSIGPIVKTSCKLLKDSFSVNEDIRLIITLTNNTNQTQSVWFDKPKSSTGGPALTSVILINRESQKSVLKYSNKGILSSQAYTKKQVEEFSYKLKPGESVSGQFSLYDLVVLNTSNGKLNVGTYDMEIFYNAYIPAKVSLTVY